MYSRKSWPRFASTLLVFHHNAFGVIAAEALKRALVVTGLIRLDARQHHSTAAFWAWRALNNLS
jgi:hypothetical protein